MKTIKIEVKKTIPDFAVGQIVPVKTDDKGIPLDKFWRDRLLDSKTDGCIAIFKTKATQSPKEDK